MKLATQVSVLIVSAVLVGVASMGAFFAFNLERGSVNGYARASYRRDRLSAMLYVNVLRVKGPNLLVFDPDEKPLQLSVRSFARR